MKAVSKKKVGLAFFICVCFCAILYVISQPSFSEEFKGTFTAGEPSDVVNISIDPLEKSFYYTDSWNDRYIKGDYTVISENRYQIYCNNTMNDTVIPPQKVIYKNNSFTLIVENERKTFKKIGDAPIIIDDENKYH